MKRCIFPIFIVFIAFLANCTPKPIHWPDEYIHGCNPPPPSVFQAADVRLDFAESTFGKIVTGDIEIETKPHIITVASQAVRDDQIKSFLRCLAIKRDGYSNEQAAYFDRLSAFMSTMPSPNEFMKWQKENPFPSIKNSGLQTPPPLTSDEISMLRSQGYNFTAQIRGGFGPMAASAFKADIEPIANKVWRDQRYEKQAPHETALIYRLYAATLLLQRPADGNIMRVINNALPWVRKAVVLDDKAGDREELEKSVSFLDQVAQGKVESVKLRVMFKHQFRVAMPGAKPEEIEKHVQRSIQLIKPLVEPSAGGSSPKEDFNYLVRYKLGDFSVGQVMESMRINFQGRFPNVDVGGQPIFAPMSNGNTLVRFVFDNGTKTLSYEWEVNKSKELIIPKNDATRELMNLRISK